MRGLLLGLVGLLLVACVPVPRLGEREALPTAVSGVVNVSPDVLTPISRRARAGGTPGPTSTPAPLATPLPPTPRAAPIAVGHSVEGVTDCLRCHGGAVSWMPSDHFKRTNATCLGCHSLAGSGQDQTATTVVRKTATPEAN